MHRWDHLYICEGQLSFSDEIIVFPEGGKYSSGYAFARKDIDPEDWFFACHFFQDPVMPGSLGVEAIIQALQCIAIQKKDFLILLKLINKKTKLKIA